MARSTSSFVQPLSCGPKGIEAMLADTACTFARHTHEDFGIGLIHRGAQKSMSGRGLVEAGPGDVITVNPGEVHDGAPLDEQGRAWRMLYLHPGLVAAVGQDILGHARQVEFSQPRLANRRLSQGFINAFDAALTPVSELSHLAWEQNLILLLSGLLQTRPEECRAIPAGIARVREQLDDAPLKAPTLAQLADAAELSRYQLLRAFTRATGLTPHAYLIQRRLQQARRLIMGGMSLVESAMASGFADQSHLTRLFKRTYGYPPGAYAKVLGDLQLRSRR
ncbi:helix-turn-helix transcriptional regulator [Pseudomonas rhizoryzae]|uniref:helix-turn-helix transcriptional regulator n=1 Tax=Pseudomonas rhizoryzae TaxID=2571129 RepID=UPI0009BD41BE|nr:AraC family transcriptional regulator [Pseudomonas rhizoryzae]